MLLYGVKQLMDNNELIFLMISNEPFIYCILYIELSSTKHIFPGNMKVSKVNHLYKNGENMC